jgi:hypothetical protein
MSDQLLPEGMKITSGKTLDERDAVLVDLGELLQLEENGITLTVALVLPLRQAKALGSELIRVAYETERHGLRIVSDEDGA